MRGTRHLIYACFIAVLLALPAAAAEVITGQASVKATGLNDDPGTVYRPGEFTAAPQDFQAANLLLNYAWDHGTDRVRIFGVNLGEDDVAAGLRLNLSDYLAYEASLDKIQHGLNLTSGYYTARRIENYRLKLLPLARLSGVYTYSVEDKTGRLGQSVYVGHKNKSQAIALLAKAGDFKLSWDMGEEDFSELTYAHDTDTTGAALSWTPSDRLFALVEFNDRDTGPTMWNTGRAIEEKSTDFSAAIRLAKRLSMVSAWSTQERTNETTGTLSFEDKYYNTSIDYTGKSARLSAGYKNIDRDYVGADITNRETETWSFGGSYIFPAVKVKGDWSHGYRDISGAKVASFVNFEEFGGEFNEQNLSAQLVSFKKVGLVYSVKRKAERYNPFALYGARSKVSRSSGLTSFLNAYDNLTFSFVYYITENRMGSRQKFTVNDPVGGGASPLDTTYDIYDGTEYYQLGGTWNYTPTTDIYFDFYQNVSELSDPHRTNRVSEKTLSLTADRRMARNYTLSGGYTWTRYVDQLDSAYSQNVNLFEFELEKEF